jgi:alkyl sulfatase BDS1-like metallo-beta-lactamase superfamily hydrolase
MDSDLEPKAATAATRAANEAAKGSLPWADRQDYEDSRRGFIATLSDVVSRADGVRVLDVRSNDFVLDGDAPDTVHPSLWGMRRCLSRTGCSR